MRIDSGDLATVAREARGQLDSLGADQTRIILTGDLDEFSIAALAAEPVDGYGVGTSLVTGSGAPTAALVYKLVARADGASPGRCGRWPSARSASRRGAAASGRSASSDQTGRAVTELVTDTEPEDAAGGRPLLQLLVRGGEIVGARADSRRRGPGIRTSCQRTACACAAAVARLPGHPHGVSSPTRE